MNNKQEHIFILWSDYFEQILLRKGNWTLIFKKWAISMSDYSFEKILLF